MIDFTFTDEQEMFRKAAREFAESEVSPYIKEMEETGKPDPTLFLRTAKSLQLSPDHCVVVEDAPEGVEAAQKAGMFCIAVANTRSRDILAKVSSSALLFDDLSQVKEENFSKLISEE